MEMKIIRQDLQAALVEWYDSDGAHRVIIPAEVANSGEITPYDLREGQPYGAEWEALVKVPSAQEVAKLLRDYNVWAFKDLQNDVKQARAAFAALYARMLKDLLQSAKSAEEG